MRKLILASAVLAAATATPALAQTSTGKVTINGAVAPRCLFTTTDAVVNAGELALPGTGTTAGRLDTSKLDGQARTLVGWCNGTASSVKVEAKPVVNTTVLTAPTGFDRVVNYTATAVANGVSASDGSVDPAVGASATVAVFTGDVVVTLSGSSTPTGGLLVAGTYLGETVITLSGAN
ncbi:hypothetical protein M9978_03835 [Sphingomonas sp. MG17]|uniref:Uncharacterized protein n=1 Tax=Sphingomonas tagetis TaxID=2949092 RepID=A0A9X2KK97_9SPHN|nr:hypothetical protein [Sphingomonas tagetis]MCP3729550.1 hypothetical protein [Sphingomonas tagetis]